jgi:hypothetical protein
MGLLIIAVLGFIVGWIAIWSTVMFNQTVEERAKSLIIGVVLDVALLALFMYNDNGAVFSLLLCFKYFFLSAINFDKTLRQ